MFLHLIVIAWLYVVVMMAVAEATNTTGTVLGAVITFVLYGVGPVALVIYLLTTPARRRRRRSARQRRLLPQNRYRPRCPAPWTHRTDQTRQMQAARRPLTPSRRCEKNRDGLCTVHQASVPSLPKTRVTPHEARR